MKTIGLLLVLFLTACAQLGQPTPQTARQREAVAEATFQSVVATIVQADDAGIIKDGDKAAIVASLTLSHAALAAWRAAVDNPQLEAAALAALAKVKGSTDVLKLAPQSERDQIDNGGSLAQLAPGSSNPFGPGRTLDQGRWIFLGFHVGDPGGPGDRAGLVR